MSSILLKNQTAFTFILPGVNGIPSQVTHCSCPVELFRGWWSKKLADFTSWLWCYIRRYRKVGLPSYWRCSLSSSLEPERISLFQSAPLAGLQAELCPHKHVPAFFLYQDRNLHTSSRYLAWGITIKTKDKTKKTRRHTENCACENGKSA